jgi:hypothetical protein
MTKEKLEYYRNYEISDEKIECIALDLLEGRKKLTVHGNYITPRQKIKELVKRFRTLQPGNRIYWNCKGWIKHVFKNRNKEI